ncbi:MAG TPA: hypothetical protein PKH39_12135 [Woeseiaceae bacterium]|nr:hypothetical protein [Woeseiaceae bacterium]
MNSCRLSARSKPASRRLLAVLALFSLNLAAMPCTMALEAVSDSGHCPSMSEQVMTQADHHQPIVEKDCFSMQSDCCSAGGVALESRGGADKLQKDVQFAVSVSPPWPTLLAHPVPVDDLRPPDLKVSFPPLHVLNCVYLD